MKDFHSRCLGLLGAMALCTAACADDGGPGAGGDTDGTDDGATTDVSSDSQTSTTNDPQTSTSTSDTGDDADEGNFIDPATDDDDGPSEPMPNGAECTSNGDCQSEFCYTVPGLGGVCSECLQDTDCEEGTCSLEFDIGYAVCTDGSLGKMCDSDEGCADDLVCAQLIDTALLDADYCSECKDNSGCTDDDICTPHFDEGSFSGHMYCAAPGSVPDDQGCPIEGGQGDGTVCENGHCGIADIMGFVQLGICGSCSTNDDCEEGETCTPASAGQDGLSGASCG